MSKAPYILSVTTDRILIVTWVARYLVPKSTLRICFLRSGTNYFRSDTLGGRVYIAIVLLGKALGSMPREEMGGKIGRQEDLSCVLEPMEV